MTTAGLPAPQLGNNQQQLMAMQQQLQQQLMAMQQLMSQLLQQQQQQQTGAREPSAAPGVNPAVAAIATQLRQQVAAAQAAKAAKAEKKAKVAQQKRQVGRDRQHHPKLSGAGCVCACACADGISGAPSVHGHVRTESAAPECCMWTCLISSGTCFSSTHS